MESDPRLKSGRLARYAAATALAAALAAPTAARGPASAVPARADDRTIVHVLNRAGFGPRPGEVAHVRQVGLRGAGSISSFSRSAFRTPRSRRGSAATRRSTSAHAKSRSSISCRRKEARKAEGRAGRARRAGRGAADGGAPGARVGRSAPATSADAMSPEMKRARQVLVELSAQKIVRAVHAIGSSKRCSPTSGSTTSTSTPARG